MKDIKSLFILLVLVLVLVGGWGMYQKFNQTSPQQSNVVQTPIDTTNWKTYRNEKYGYEFKAPEINSFSVEPIEPNWMGSYRGSTLEEYVKAVWQKNHDDKNPNIKNKTISDITKLDGKERETYSFRLSGSYEGLGSIGLLNEEHTFIFSRNNRGVLFIVSYPTKDKISQEVVKTFSINEDWILPKDPPKDWQVYKDNQNLYSFEYPGNIFSSGKNFQGKDSLTSRRGSLSVMVLEKRLYPQNIMGMYGKVEAIPVTVGDRIGYMYGLGDAGCGAKIVEMALTERTTLQISFGSCSDDLYSLADDADLQNRILSTFKFTSAEPIVTEIIKTDSWKEYTYYEGVVPMYRFKYPPDWKLFSKDIPQSNPSYVPLREFSIVSPDNPSTIIYIARQCVVEAFSCKQIEYLFFSTKNTELSTLDILDAISSTFQTLTRG